MKRLFVIAALMCLALSVFSQENVLKGRAIGNAKLFSLGLGYERFVAGSWSAQLLYNHTGWDFGDTDGSAQITSALILEGRYYFGRHKKETLNKASFLGVFLEQSWADLHPGGEQGYEAPKIYKGGNRRSTNPGLLLGRNFQLTKRWYLEFYSGARYKFGLEQKEYLIDQKNSTEKKNIKKLAIRLGCNIGFRF